MRYIDTLVEGETIRNIYLCKGKRSAETRNGKPYDNLILQDKTGTLDGKVWDPNSNGIADYDEKDFIEVFGDVISPYLRGVIEYYFEKDEKFIRTFKGHSAAKSVHHGFAGGLLEHTLSVVKFCEYMVGQYDILNKDLLYTAAMCHDIGKTIELSPFPENDYTDEGQLLGHIMIGAEMVGERIRTIEGFPVRMANELKHCILAHHGELEYGSPKKPALAEALALSFADNVDAKMETIREIFTNVPENSVEWQGFNRLLDSNIRRSSLK